MKRRAHIGIVTSDHFAVGAPVTDAVALAVLLVDDRRVERGTGCSFVEKPRREINATLAEIDYIKVTSILSSLKYEYTCIQYVLYSVYI